MEHPRRTCVGCGRVDIQRNLLRLVRITDGQVALDPARRKPGRGAYVHLDSACVKRGLTPKALARSFRASTRATPQVVAAAQALVADGGEHRTAR